MKKALVISPLFLGTFASLSFAQPDVNNAPKGENPQNRRAGDAARRIQMNQMERTRNQLKKLGVVEIKQQEAVLAFVQSEVKAREELVSKGEKLNQSLRNEGLTTAQIAGALNDYQAAIDDNKVRREKAIAAFKKEVDYSKNPRLESFLVLAGVIGDGPVVAAGNPGRVRIRENFRVNGKDPNEKPAEAAPAAGTPATAKP